MYLRVLSLKCCGRLVCCLISECDCKHNMLHTAANLEAAGAVNTRGDPVSTALGRSRVVDGGRSHVG